MKSRLLALALSVTAAQTNLTAMARIKDLASVQGVRDNQLIGYGLVVGLAGTGDRQQTVFSVQALTNLLQRMGVTVPPGAVTVKNTASVLVTATLPPFAQSGQKLDIDVAAIGDASNLQGGMLILTPLKAANGIVYALAQGSVVTGGFVAGRGGNSTTVNHPTVGRVIEGAIVERAPPTVAPTAVLNLQIRRPDFMTASRMASAINQKFNSEQLARAINSGLVAVQIPDTYKEKSVDFIAAVESLSVEADEQAKIAINERTGTVVFGGDIHISPASILHGNLTVNIQTSYNVSQPAPFSNGGTTQVIPQVNVQANPDKARDIVLKNGATVDELVRSLSAIGSTPRDIIDILESLKVAGALDAQIEIL